MPDLLITRTQRTDGSFAITVPSGSVVLVDGMIHSSTATIAPTAPGALGATATLADAAMAAANVAINTIKTALIDVGILTATA
jgi:hypothetical protein